MTQLYIKSIQPANKALEHLINSYDQYWREKKPKTNKRQQTNTKQNKTKKKEKKKGVSAYLIKNSKGVESHSHKQSERLGGVLWVYKVGLKEPVIAKAITRKPHFLSLTP